MIRLTHILVKQKSTTGCVCAHRQLKTKYLLYESSRIESTQNYLFIKQIVSYCVKFKEFDVKLVALELRVMLQVPLVSLSGVYTSRAQASFTCSSLAR